MKINNKPVRVIDLEAIILIKKRAKTENRSASNAAATTIIEALSGKYGTPENKSGQ